MGMNDALLIKINSTTLINLYGARHLFNLHSLRHLQMNDALLIKINSTTLINLYGARHLYKMKPMSLIRHRCGRVKWNHHLIEYVDLKRHQMKAHTNNPILDMYQTHAKPPIFNIPPSIYGGKLFLQIHHVSQAKKK